MLLTGFLVLPILIDICYCFNIDTNNPIVYEDPSKYLFPNVINSSYFGYSVVLYPGNRSRKPWILSGAPKGSDAKNQSSGMTFKCGIGETCEIFDVNGLSKYSGKNYEEKIDTAWIGGSMDVNYASGRIVTCAPRWIKVKIYSNKVNDYHMQGACYWFHTTDTNTQKILPLLEPNHDVYTHPGTGSSVYWFAQGQAGFSVHMPTKEKQLVLGAPGVFNWDGTSILYKDDDESTPVASRLLHTRRRARDADPSEFNYKNIGNAIDTKETLAYDLLGYSTTSGYFYNNTNLLYVTSAPRSDYLGQILIYDFDKGLEASLRVKETKHGQQFGEYFGAAVTAGDVNRDGLDDLIVGAPFHSTKKYNEGKVYIFLGSTSGRLQTPQLDSIVGTSTNGQFGTTLQYLGDINHDGFGDLAVAAPYEEESSGVVYLFRGTRNGLDTTYCQRIVGKDLYPSIKGFGMSISRAVDMSFNGYPDVAIGAYLSGHVAVLRTRPVITIYQTLEPLVSHLEFKTRQFAMRACFWYQLDQLDPGTISINRSLTLDQQLGRAYLQPNDYIKIIDLQPSQTFCENFTVSLTNSFSNRYDPIKVSLSHLFLTKETDRQVILVSSNVQGSDMFCPRCPVYDTYGSKSLTEVEIPFALGCKSGNICKASLEMKPTITNIEADNTFVLGSKNYITLQTDIENFGEKAYLTQLLVTVPEIVSFRSTPSACTEKNSSSVLCSVDNPLDSNSRKLVTLELDMITVNSGKYDNSLVFTVEISTSSENDRAKTKTLEVKLKREADVTINGKSEEQSYSYRNITQGKPNFTQIYQVEKFGSSPLNEIVVEINVPYIFEMNDGTRINFVSLYPPVGTLAGQEFMCRSNFSYLKEVTQASGPTDLEVVEDENTISKEALKRSVRQVEVFNKSTTVRERITKENEFDGFQNRTYYLNCSMNEVICSKVVCSAGPIKSGQIGKIKLKMLFDIAAINDVLGKKDVVLFATQGRVMVTSPREFVQSGDKADSVEVVSLFVGDLYTEDVALWIIIASAIAGLLLLLLLVVALIKAGFFKRTTKEELEQLKKEIEFNEGANLNQNMEEN